MIEPRVNIVPTSAPTKNMFHYTQQKTSSQNRSPSSRFYSIIQTGGRGGQKTTEKCQMNWPTFKRLFFRSPCHYLPYKYKGLELNYIVTSNYKEI